MNKQDLEIKAELEELGISHCENVKTIRPNEDGMRTVTASFIGGMSLTIETHRTVSLPMIAVLIKAQVDKVWPQK